MVVPIWPVSMKTIGRRSGIFLPAEYAPSVTTLCRCSIGRAHNSTNQCLAVQPHSGSTCTNTPPSTATCWSGKRRELEYSEEVLQRARAWRDAATEADRNRVLDTIMAGLPGAFERYDIPGLRDVLGRYQRVTKADVRTMLVAFLKEIIPVAEECGIAMAIHPDDPPRPLFGLPRIVGSAEDIDFIINAVPSVSNGLTLCTGSLGAGAGNDLPAIARRFAPHIHFAHLRNVTKDEDGSFMEAEHLGGDVDMVAVVQTLLNEQDRRRAAGERDRVYPSAQTTDGSCLMMFTRRRTPATRRSAVCVASPNCAASSLHFGASSDRGVNGDTFQPAASLSNTTFVRCRPNSARATTATPSRRV